MGIMDAQLLTGKVMHKRLFPKQNAFQYGIYYLALPLSQLAKMPLAYNRFASLSFFDKDHGPCDGSSLDIWARAILREHNIQADGEITLVCMPRVFGYAFNPVSFWLCQDKAGQIRAVLCEVHNTFGERHTYLCAHEDRRPVNELSLLFAEKLFHVSPFLAREGHYEFRFDVHDDVFNVVINLHHEEGHKLLITSLTGKLQALTKSSLRYAFWHYPLVTLKAIVMIHWQALKLVVKGIKYMPKPEQKPQKVSTTN
ncbi:MAG: DUF1365 domain-containing protein [Betaproteobacteria bacterium]|nr:DUF1365 domain-containing protein [Betaproteobacteria bacterium]